MPSLGDLARRVPEAQRRALADGLLPRPLPEGETAPEWQLQSWDGSWHRLQRRWSLLIFYPADHTPGCTLQLQDVQAHLPQLQALGCEVYGINPAEAPSHRSFAESCQLGFPLLSDRGASVARRYQATLPLLGKVLRTVYLINPAGKIRLANRGAPSVAAIVRSIEALKEATRGGM
jgi:peroxiredoxin Q/BCP